MQYIFAVIYVALSTSYGLIQGLLNYLDYMGNLPCNLHLHHHTWQGTHSCKQGRCWHKLAQYHPDTVCCILNDIASITIVTCRLRSEFSCTKDTKPQSRNLWHVYYIVCTRSSDPFYIVTYYIKWVTTSRADPNHP